MDQYNITAGIFCGATLGHFIIITVLFLLLDVLIFRQLYDFILGISTMILLLNVWSPQQTSDFLRNSFLVWRDTSAYI